MKSTITTIMLASSIVGTGCMTNHDSPTPKKQRELRLNLQGEPRSLDPRKGDRRSQVVLRMLFDGLTRIGRDNQPQPALAERIDLSEDQMTYTFYLREAQWSNGMPITAEDFVWTWREMVHPDFDSPFSWAFDPIHNAKQVRAGQLPLNALGVSALDKRTLVVTMEHPTSYFLYFCSSSLLAPVCSHVAQRHPHWCHEASEHFVCSGPFQLASWEHQSEIQIVHNPRYWDAAQVALERISLSMVEDPQAVFELFEAGKLDWAGEPLSELPLSAVGQLAAQDRLRTCLAGGVYQLRFNVEIPPLHCAAFRRALSAAIDREGLIEYVLQGGQLAAKSILPPCLALGGAEHELGDVQKAKQHLKQALQELGCTVEALPSLTYTYANVEGHKAIAQAIVNQWQDVLGLEVSLQGMEWNQYLSKMARAEHQIAAAPWYSWHNDPSYNLEMLKSTKRYNPTRWEHPEYAARLNAADQELSAERRNALLRGVEKMVVEAMPVAPLFVTSYKYLASDALEGVFITDLGQVDFRWAYFR